METKKEFMLLFRFEPNFDYQPSQEEMNQMQQEWGAFFENLAGQGKLVSTYQLGFEGTKVAADKSIEHGIYVSDKQTLGGNLIVSVNTIDEATEIAKNCPILNMGGNVEVRSIQPM
ncbi:MAG: YciI family protein [Flavobacterium sp.]|uniref:YciI family protein n=1 Tax=Flavobacterium sp. TaxID=239 RepID=UPI0022C08F94|nr:YciI family protein [Flavobacterium sp.]MCZ8197891.1 YciI family protein [Flavobacterium sp.]